MNSFLKSSERDLYDGYNTLYHAFFFARSDTLPLPLGRSPEFVVAVVEAEDVVVVTFEVLFVDDVDAIDATDKRWPFVDRIFKDKSGLAEVDRSTNWRISH